VVYGLKINPYKSHGLKTRIITVITGRKAPIVEDKKTSKEQIENCRKSVTDGQRFLTKSAKNRYKTVENPSLMVTNHEKNP
jgi:hypothetical protein